MASGVLDAVLPSSTASGRSGDAYVLAKRRSRSRNAVTCANTHKSGCLLEPDALVLAAHGVEQERNQRGVEEEADDHGGGEDLGTEDREQQHHLEDRAADGDRVSPLLLVGDAQCAGGEAGGDEEVEEH